MNYADMALGTWYPKGGMYQVIDGMVKLARSVGVKFEFNADVQQVIVRQHGVRSNDRPAPNKL
jgi:phytoene desaturase